MYLLSFENELFKNKTKLQDLESLVHKNLNARIPLEFIINAKNDGLAPQIKHILSNIMSPHMIEKLMSCQLVEDIVQSNDLIAAYNIAESVLENSDIREELIATINDGEKVLHKKGFINSLTPLSSGANLYIQACKLFNDAPFSRLQLDVDVSKAIGKNIRSSMRYSAMATFFYKTPTKKVVKVSGTSILFLPDDFSQQIIKHHVETVNVNNEFWTTPLFNV
ncbi:hypothetical protein [Photobacterium kishitanii]|uniref:Uncharacterized protein n=1 Tax=Photobacterium kishitanii TaxID=318456 RepID=A0A2T3KKZ1_9GAMM|nr:hypothetical protein [Photobacterium kishitanii]PSV00336.1 hypothetical protein C9J27_04210 [Photobacterium kishitanii]